MDFLSAFNEILEMSPAKVVEDEVVLPDVADTYDCALRHAGFDAVELPPGRVANRTPWTTPPKPRECRPVSPLFGWGGDRCSSSHGGQVAA